MKYFLLVCVCFITFQFEDNSQAALSYVTGGDQAQGTAYQRFFYMLNN